MARAFLAWVAIMMAVLMATGLLVRQRVRLPRLVPSRTAHAKRHLLRN